MSERFAAEAILRAAASGAFPNVGDFLIRAQDGWIFSAFDEDGITISFDEIEGHLNPGQMPDPIFVNVINERSTGLGTTVEGVLIRDSVIPEVEARARFSRR